MLEIEVINSIDNLEKLQESWNETFKRSSFDDVHLTWEWFYAWCKNFKEKDVFIAIVKQDRKVLAIIPLMKEKGSVFGLPVRKIKALRNDYSARFDIILTEKKEECMTAVFKYFEKEKWNLIEFGNILSGSSTIDIMEILAKKNIIRIFKEDVRERCPYIAIEGKWDEYYDKLSKKFQRNIKSREIKLNTIGKVTLTELVNSEVSDVSIEKFFSIEKAGWKGDIGTAIACSKESESFYKDLAKLMSKKGCLNLFFLKLDNKEIAADYCLNYKGVLSLEKTGYDAGYSKYSPGILLRKRVLEDAFNDSVTKFDFLGSYQAWKKDWTSQTQKFIPLWVYRKDAYSTVVYFLQFGIKDFFKRMPLILEVKRKIFSLFNL